MNLDAGPPLPARRAYAFRLVNKEREQQDAKWQDVHSKREWLTIITEEMGELASAILGGDDWAYASEVIQVAAVAIAMVEDVIDEIEK